MYDVYSKFSLQSHKETYVCYLEAIMFPDGHVEYAVPSHQEKLIRICCKTLHVTRAELADMCPPTYYADFLHWLCNTSNCISLWTDFYVAPQQGVSDRQKLALQDLKTAEVYYGKILKEHLI